jgi:hypothetical protein
MGQEYEPELHIRGAGGAKRVLYKMEIAKKEHLSKSCLRIVEQIQKRQSTVPSVQEMCATIIKLAGVGKYESIFMARVNELDVDSLQEIINCFDKKSGSSAE